MVESAISSSTGPDDVYLVNPTKAEVDDQVVLNSVEWKGALSSVEAYIRREAFLQDQDLTRNGGLTDWALARGQGDKRQILSSCETLRKKAFVVTDGKLQEIICHGICSVFCSPENRGKGYASTMIKLLGKKLQTWQTDTAPCLFSILYSDVGKQFYARNGYQVYPSSHVSLAPWPGSSSSRASLPPVRPLSASDLPELCKIDEELLRKRITRTTNQSQQTVAIVPDYRTLAWHHAREDFVSKELYGQTSDIRGAITGSEPGHRVWMYWARMWYNTDPKSPSGNTMHIMRLVVEDDTYDYSAATDAEVESSEHSETTKAIAALLTAAQSEASRWNMGDVEIWNPTSATMAAARMLDPSAEIEHREKDSIASLRWYGDAAESVEWIDNEKYGWC